MRGNKIYSGDLKTDNSKSRNIGSQDFEGQFLNGLVIKWLGFSNGYSYGPNQMVPTIQNQEIFVRISNGFLINGGNLSGLKR